MSHLPFISDEDLIKHTKELVDAAVNAAKKVEKNPYKNVIDPFSALVDAARQAVSIDEWMEQEKSRQIQKSFQNAVGEFHQHILGSVPGWEDLAVGGGYDVINEERKIIAEIKNKHNTMNAGASRSVYDTMSSFLDYGKKDFTAYVVDIVPKSPSPYIIQFAPSVRGVRLPSRDNLLRTDGRSFYALVTGYPDAIDQLYKALPWILSDILKVDDKILTGTDDFNIIFDKAYLKK
ncbi:MAG TPA: Eco47II family restriction endonuclease [Candidatus Microsaccharimonas sp.]|jgi:hypothetical protein